MLPEGLSPAEQREACRALRGAMLRQEVYALDGSARAGTPYAVAEQSFSVRRLQPRADNPRRLRRARRETSPTTTNATPADPRVAHELTLESTRTARC